MPTLIAWVGALTALFAATIAVAQNDIKKVLAYSTVSQLGYMFLAVGSGAYVAAIFHMITHAFFKALLFLGAGSVIHGMHDEQDMRRMGGAAQVHADHRRHVHRRLAGHRRRAAVRRLLVEGRDPRCPPGARAPALWAIGLVTALLTAFYMSRQVFMVFFGEPAGERRADDAGRAVATRGDDATRRPVARPRRIHPHESPWTMTVPLVVLAACAVVGGLLNLPFTERLKFLEHWLEPVLESGEAPTLDVAAGDEGRARGRRRPSSALAGIALACLVYLRRTVEAEPVEPEVLAHAWYYDEAHRRVRRRARAEAASRRPAWFDEQRRRRRRQRRRPPRARRLGARLRRRCRPATSATTRSASPSAPSSSSRFVLRERWCR